MSSQFRLVGEKRFGPFFLTQFFGAFNDNVYKNALIILIAFQLGDPSTSLSIWLPRCSSCRSFCSRQQLARSPTSMRSRG